MLRTRYLLETVFPTLPASDARAILKHTEAGEGEYLMWFDGCDAELHPTLLGLLSKGFDLSGDGMNVDDHAFEHDEGLWMAPTHLLQNTFYNHECYKDDVAKTMAIRDALPKEADAHGNSCADCHSTNGVVFCGEVAKPPRNLCFECLTTPRLIPTKMRMLFKYSANCESGIGWMDGWMDGWIDGWMGRNSSHTQNMVPTMKVLLTED